MAAPPPAHAAPAAPLKKGKRRTSFKPQLGAVAPPIAWLSPSDSASMLPLLRDACGAHRGRVAAGLNAASRCVESGRALVLVMARPALLRLVQHLPLLAAAKRVPVLPLAVPSLSPALPHLPSCLAFAITRAADGEDDGADAAWAHQLSQVRAKCPPPSAPWLHEPALLLPPRVERKAPRRAPA